MYKHVRIGILLGLLPLFPAFAGESQLSAEDYIARYKEMAISNMHEMGVPASITLAQGMLESGNGNSRLAVEANNHFGIKCHSDWNGPTISEDDDARNECFRKYRSAQDSYRDHAAFLKNKQRYAFLFDIPLTDYKGWAHGLKKAGYATHPQYAGRLIGIIEKHALYQYDRGTDSPAARNTEPAKAGEKKDKSRQPVRKKKIKAVRGEGSAIVSEIGLSARRKIELVNNTPYVVARKGDTFYRIAVDFDLELWQIFKYNDLGKDHVLQEGEKVYLKPKRRKAGTGTHIISEGDTWHAISQRYGIKIKHLFRYNDLKAGDMPEAGRKIWLKRPG